MVTREEYESALEARHTKKLHDKIKTAHVAVAGLGGVGSNIAILLARAGVGHIHLVDFDMVELSNLHRQQYDTEDIGTLKTEALRGHIKRFNPFVEVTCDNVRVDEDSAAKIFGKYPIVCEAFDRAESKAMLVNALLTQCEDTVVIASSGMAGLDGANMIQTRKINGRFYLCGDTKNDACEGGGLFAPRAALCAAHQALLALRIITGKEK